MVDRSGETHVGYYEVVAELPGGIKIVKGEIGLLREAEVNAHVMPKDVFERLVENIKKRGQLESLPYCAQPEPDKPPQIVSGHHRIRAARAAGLVEIHYLLDTAQLTRSQIIAKQIAHNALVGIDDRDLLRKLAAMMDSVDDFLESGLPDELLPSAEEFTATLWMPHADFQFKSITLAFLPHQLDNLKELLGSLKGPMDMLLVAMPEQFEAFIKATAAYSRIKDVRAAGTAVALLTEIALREIHNAEVLEAAAQEEANAGKPVAPGEGSSDAVKPKQQSQRKRTAARA